MEKFSLKSGPVFLFGLLVLFSLISLSWSKQPMRIASGLECMEPGYFRDIHNCRKFYYCPFPATKEKEPMLTEQEKFEWKNFIIKGMTCPKGSFFDERTAFCESFNLAPVIPPKCEIAENILEGDKQRYWPFGNFEEFRDSTTENIPELLRSSQ